MRFKVVTSYTFIDDVDREQPGMFSTGPASRLCCLNVCLRFELYHYATRDADIEHPRTFPAADPLWFVKWHFGYESRTPPKLHDRQLVRSLDK